MRDPYGGCASQTDVNQRAGILLEKAIEIAHDPEAVNFLVDLFGSAQLDIWAMFPEHRLSAKDEARYREHYETAALTFAAPSALPVGERLLTLHRAGRLRVVRGVKSAAFDGTKDVYVIEHEFGVENATTLVNTTGSVDRDVTSARQPELVRDLVRKGLLQPYARDGLMLKGAAVDMSTFRLQGSQKIYLASKLLWGPGFFTSSAFMLATVVQRMLSNIFDV